MGEPGHREVAEEGEEALRRLEHAVSVVCFGVETIGAIVVDGLL